MSEGQQLPRMAVLRCSASSLGILFGINDLINGVTLCVRGGVKHQASTLDWSQRLQLLLDLFLVYTITQLSSLTLCTFNEALTIYSDSYTPSSPLPGLKYPLLKQPVLSVFLIAKQNLKNNYICYQINAHLLWSTKLQFLLSKPELIQVILAKRPRRPQIGGSVDWSIIHTPKGFEFYSRSEHIPRNQV